MHARGALRRQPGSRSEVFTSRDLSAADKRALMRALKTVADAATPPDATAEAGNAASAPLPPPFDDGAASFTAALAAAGLSPELRAAALHALALRDADVTCAEGVAALQRRVAQLVALFDVAVVLTPLCAQLYGLAGPLRRAGRLPGAAVRRVGAAASLLPHRGAPHFALSSVAFLF